MVVKKKIAPHRTRTTNGAESHLPSYIRPDPHLYTTHDAAPGRKIGENMWVLSKLDRGNRAGFITKVASRIPGKGGVKGTYRYRAWSVPTNSKGEIPDMALISRIMDVKDGDRNGKERNMWVDFGIDSAKVSKISDLADSYRWYLNPNESDIKEIDDKNTKVVTILSKTKTGKRSLVIAGGDEKQRSLLATHIKDNFTIKEKKQLAGVFFMIHKTPQDVAGYFTTDTGKYGADESLARIVIDPRWVNKGEVVIHEAIHALRMFDKDRPPQLRAPVAYYGRDKDLEESMTEAETVGREKPLTKHKSKTGYYGWISSRKRTLPEILVKEDRITLTKPKNPDDFIKSGRKGKAVQKALINHYPETNISRMKMDGGVEAIDTYYRIEHQPQERKGKKGKRVTHMQLYSPLGGIAQTKKLNKLLSKGGSDIGRWDDGKLKAIKGKPRISHPKAPSIRR